MGSRFFLLAMLSMPLVACSWGFEGEGDAGIVEGNDDDDSGVVDDPQDAGEVPDEPDADLSFCDNSTLTYANFGQGFMDSYCLECHATGLNSALRRGAPESVNFDTFELIQSQANRVRARVSENQNMPPNSASQPSNEERENMAEWIDCGLAE